MVASTMEDIDLFGSEAKEESANGHSKEVDAQGDGDGKEGGAQQHQGNANAANKYRRETTFQYFRRVMSDEEAAFTPNNSGVSLGTSGSEKKLEEETEKEAKEAEKEDAATQANEAPSVVVVRRRFANDPFDGMSPVKLTPHSDENEEEEEVEFVYSEKRNLLDEFTKWVTENVCRCGWADHQDDMQSERRDSYEDCT